MGRASDQAELLQTWHLTFAHKTTASDPRELPSTSASELSSPILILRCSKSANFILKSESSCRALLVYVPDGKYAPLKVLLP